MPYGIEDTEFYNSIKQPTNVIEYGQYYHRPKTTTTKRTITVEEYDENGKLVKKRVETTEDTITTSSWDKYPYTVTWNNTNSGGIEVKYAGDPVSVGASVKEALELMDSSHIGR